MNTYKFYGTTKRLCNCNGFSLEHALHMDEAQKASPNDLYASLMAFEPVAHTTYTGNPKWNVAHVTEADDPLQWLQEAYLRGYTIEKVLKFYIATYWIEYFTTAQLWNIDTMYNLWEEEQFGEK